MSEEKKIPYTISTKYNGTS